MVGSNVFLVVFEGAGTADLNAKLVHDVVARGGRSALCGANGAGPFALPPAPARLTPVLEILVAQLVTLALAARLGREAGRFSHATKVTSVQ